MSRNANEVQAVDRVPEVHLRTVTFLRLHRHGGVDYKVDEKAEVTMKAHEKLTALGVIAPN